MTFTFVCRQSNPGNCYWFQKNVYYWDYANERRLPEHTPSEATHIFPTLFSSHVPKQSEY